MKKPDFNFYEDCGYDIRIVSTFKREYVHTFKGFLRKLFFLEPDNWTIVGYSIKRASFGTCSLKHCGIVPLSDEEFLTRYWNSVLLKESNN